MSSCDIVKVDYMIEILGQWEQAGLSPSGN